MQIIDTYPEIIEILNRMSGRFDMALWEQYANGISKELPGLLKKDYADNNQDDQNRIITVLNAVITERDKLEITHHSFSQAIGNDLDKRIYAVCGADLHVTIMLYLGLCNGAGWATTLDGIPAVLLGIEKIAELNWHGADDMRALIYHELGHIWHEQFGKMHQKTPTMRDKYILQLYQEGIAGYFEQLLYGDLNKYHQDKNGWLDWCKENKSELNHEYLRRLAQNESAHVFFGDWQNYQGWGDVGYFIGCEFVKSLASKYSLTELANLDISVIYNEFTAYSQKTQ